MHARRILIDRSTTNISIDDICRWQMSANVKGGVRHCTVLLVVVVLEVWRGVWMRWDTRTWLTAAVTHLTSWTTGTSQIAETLTQTDRQTDGRTDRQTDGQTDRLHQSCDSGTSFSFDFRHSVNHCESDVVTLHTYHFSLHIVLPCHCQVSSVSSCQLECRQQLLKHRIYYRRLGRRWLWYHFLCLSVCL